MEYGLGQIVENKKLGNSFRKDNNDLVRTDCT